MKRRAVRAIGIAGVRYIAYVCNCSQCSMGAKSFIVSGKGNADSFCSCSHGAGRKMSRTAARKRFTVDDHIAATSHVECRKDEGVVDETPMAYKDIEAVMAAQSDLVDVRHTLRQVVCVKG